MDKENKLILYKDDKGKVNVNVRFADEDVWLTRENLAEIYATTPQNISLHVGNIYQDKELSEEGTRKKFFLVRQEGKRQVQREIDHYNLDMIIALGYRVQSSIAVRFRRWATQRLHEYIQKGFTMDDERLKQGGNRYFKELLQRIRDIRSSERNFYQQVTDIYATSTDYDPRAKMTKLFFATVQNKMHYAVHEHTAAELIYERVDNEKPFVGMTNFKGNYVTRDDVKIAKNYLTELELQRLNLLTSQFLDYAEFQALEQNPMTMADWIAALDDQILRLRKNILEGNGTVSHQEAIEKAVREFEIYREREMRMLVSDFDNDIKHLSETERQFLSAEDEVGKLAAIELLNVNIKGKTFKENIEDWLNEPFQSNPNHLENLKISAANGLLVRSKSEAFIASELYAAGIPFRYECLLILNNGNALYPDFTILNPYTKEIVIWEHFGMMEDEEYSKLAMIKTKDYISNGFIPDRNLILTYETKNAPLDFGLVKKKVKYLFA